MLAQPSLRLVAMCLTLSLATVLSSGCSDTPSEDPQPVSSAAQSSTPKPPTVERDIFEREALIDLGATTLQASLEAAIKLQTAVNDLLKDPNAEAHSLVAERWREAVSTYEAFSPFVKLAQSSPALAKLPHAHYRIAQWPIQPGYLDAFGEHAFSGLVFDIGVPLDEYALREQHGMMDKEGATLGFYPLEYLLFGEQNQRSFMIFKPVTTLSAEHKEQGHNSVDEIPSNRRRTLIEKQAQLLINDLSVLNTAWQESTGNSRLQDESDLPLAQQLAMLQPGELQTSLKNGLRQLVAEQMISIVEISQANPSELGLQSWQNKQLALRLSAQYTGILDLLEITTPLYSAEAIEAAQAVADELAKFINQTSAADTGNTTWKPVTEALQKFAEFTRKTISTQPS